MRLILWDIDHTLISTGGVGRELSATAFERVLGQPMLRQAAIDGMTEPVIFRETAALHGITTDRADFERFARELTAQHTMRAADLRERGHALPGAAAALDALAQVEGLAQTVVSGNVRGVARVKLKVFGLDRHIDWTAGSYGEDADERPDLVRSSLTRASERFGQVIAPGNAVLVGDTPADVAAGRATGVRVIAVATGRSSTDQLLAAGADHVLKGLEDTARLVECVRGGA